VNRWLGTCYACLGERLCCIQQLRNPLRANKKVLVEETDEKRIGSENERGSKMSYYLLVSYILLVQSGIQICPRSSPSNNDRQELNAGGAASIPF